MGGAFSVQARKIPMRMCTGCGEMKPKKELIRVVRTPEGAFELDFTGKKSGRGAYLCRDLSCLKNCKKTKRLEKSFGCRIPDEVYMRLESELEE